MPANETKETSKSQLIIERNDLQELFDSLTNMGYQIVGPTVKQEAIVYDTLESVDDLPIGWTDEQNAGSYRLKKREDEALFGYSLGPQSWKRYLFPPSLRLWQAKRNGNEFEIVPEEPDDTRYAFFGARSCELHAMAIQDKVFTGGSHVDPNYQSVRDRIFVVAVNCSQAGGTCFCVSMNTGPKADSGYDISLTEVIENGDHYFVVDVATTKGEAVLECVRHHEASSSQAIAADQLLQNTSNSMGREMNTSGIKELLYQNNENPQWDDIADRCLSCANCTLVCPTCFCNTIEDTSDLTGQNAERWRKWDSCFTMDYSGLHGGSVRSSAKSRYRQWMTHKLASWFDQFGSSGCVGCGRCISWCPVGIDITQELQTIRTSDKATFESDSQREEDNAVAND